jgi:hypothetical protein
MGRYYGIAAVNMIDKKEYGKMVLTWFMMPEMENTGEVL